MGQYQFGKKALMDAIKNSIQVSQVILGAKNEVIINLCKQNNIHYKIVDRQWFNRFDNTLNHQFIAFEINQGIISDSINKSNLNNFLKKHKDNKNLTIVILDEIEDARNFGAILRSCAAFDVDAVIFKKDHQAPINDLAIKTSMGAINYLELIEVVNLTNTINTLKENGFWIYGTMLDKSAKSLYITDFSARCAIIFGNENRGIGELVSKNLDIKVYIPMCNNVQSLNVSVATGICLSYIFNQIKK